MIIRFTPSPCRPITIALVVSLLSTVCLLPGFGQDAEEAPGDIILVERPLKADTGFYEKTILEYSSDILAINEDQEAFTENPTATIDFEADQLIVATTPDGYAKELMMRVNKLVSLPLDDNDEAETLLAPGTYVHAIADKEGCLFSIDGREIEDEESARILDDLIGLLEEDPDVTREDMLATGKDHPRKPGERWMLDRNLLAKLMTSDEDKVNPSEVYGNAMYHGLVESRGEQCQRLTYAYAVQVDSNREPNPRRFFRNLTVDLPSDTSKMERSFKLRRWTRIDQRFNNNDGFQNVRAVVYLLDYDTLIDPITDENLLDDLREAYRSHQEKAAEKLAEEADDDEASDGETTDPGEAEDVDVQPDADEESED